jgi:hypothetical protein
MLCAHATKRGNVYSLHVMSNDVTSSNIATFADDTKIFKTINSISDAAALQCDLSRLDQCEPGVKCKQMQSVESHP